MNEHRRLITRAAYFRRSSAVRASSTPLSFEISPAIVSCRVPLSTYTFADWPLPHPAAAIERMARAHGIRRAVC